MSAGDERNPCREYIFELPGFGATSSGGSYLYRSAMGRWKPGFYWATYKALCRRTGVFQNTTGLHDLNADLTEPIMKGLANNWEKAFGRRLPNVLENFSRKSKTLLYQFHKEVETRCVKNGIGSAGMGMLGQQLRNYKATFADLVEVMKDLVNDIQRNANREFTPTIASNLATSYEWCAREVGPGRCNYPRKQTR
jgi:hypothetical protein